MNTAQVQVISIWSKFDGLEGKLRGRDKNVHYTVEVEVGATVDETLENAFVLTNQDERPARHVACSTTAGDILRLDEQDYLVEGSGFRAVTATESAIIQRMSSRDTSFGYEFLKSRGLL